MNELWLNPAAERIASEVTARTGMIIVPGRRRIAEVSIERAMMRAGVMDADRFVALLDEAHPVLDDLVAELTVGETYFFRESAQFDLLRQTIVPELRERHGAAYGVRAWSAACASGEEAYSIAIALRESSDAPHFVVGTDISRERLARARGGRFRRWSLRGVPDMVVGRYFTETGDEVRLAPEIRRTVTFRYLNLAEDSLPALASGVWGMDVVFCRNVLIYFDRDTIARVAQRLIESLSEDGWLILGAADPPLGDVVDCEVVQTAAGIVYRRATAANRRPARVISRVEPPAPISFAITEDRPPASARASEEPPTRVAEVATHREETSVAQLYDQSEYEQVVTRVRAMSGPTTPDSIALVRSLANLGLLAEAGTACATALDTERMSAELQYLHAILLLQASMPDDAAQAARRALYLDPSLIVAHLALGTALTRLRRFPEATRALANAEALLNALRAETRVPASDGELAGRLLNLARSQRELVERSAA